MVADIWSNDSEKFEDTKWIIRIFKTRDKKDKNTKYSRHTTTEIAKDWVKRNPIKSRGDFIL